MKRFVFLFGVWVLMLSCTRDADEIVAPTPEPLEPVSPYAVSVEEALQSLSVALQQIDGADETRSGQVRIPRSIHPVKASEVCTATRSEIAPDLDDLFYVVSFGDGNGSAVLGADRRVSSVFAILDETVLTSDDFIEKETTRGADLENEDPERDIRVYLTNLIKEAGARDLLIDIPRPPLVIVPKSYRDTVINRTFCKPMIKTKWGQDSPYNKYCPPKLYSEGNCPAGCAPIAFAQLFCELPYPDPLIIEGVVFDRNVLKQNSDEAAWYCRVVGIPLRTLYADNGSSTNPEHVAETFRNLGWTEAGLIEYNYYTAYITVYLQRKPFYLRGETVAREGHAWLVDGWDSYVKQRWEIKHYSRTSTGGEDKETLLSEESVNMVHCNFGWFGECDGYYAHHVFDTRYRLDEEFIDKDAGDIMSVNSYLFDRQFFMIGY